MRERDARAAGVSPAVGTTGKLGVATRAVLPVPAARDQCFGKFKRQKRQCYLTG